MEEQIRLGRNEWININYYLVSQSVYLFDCLLVFDWEKKDLVYFDLIVNEVICCTFSENNPDLNSITTVSIKRSFLNSDSLTACTPAIHLQIQFTQTHTGYIPIIPLHWTNNKAFPLLNSVNVKETWILWICSKTSYNYWDHKYLHAQLRDLNK